MSVLRMENRQKWYVWDIKSDATEINYNTTLLARDIRVCPLIVEYSVHYVLYVL